MKDLDTIAFRHNVAAFQIAIAKKQLRDKVNVDFIWQRNAKLVKQENNIIRITVEE